MKLYHYSGPVLEFDKIVSNNWSASTLAESEKKARCNLAYKFKMEHGKIPRSKISIPGKLIIIEGDDKDYGRI